MNETEVANLVTELKAAANEPVERRVFDELYGRTIATFDIDDIEVARVAKVAIPTAMRWRTGASAPVPRGRPSVILALLKLLEERELRSVHRLQRALLRLSERKVAYRIRSVAYDQTGLAGRLAFPSQSLLTDDADYPADLPAGLSEVVIVSDTPNPHLTLLVHPVGDPRRLALVDFRQLTVIG